MNTSTASIKEKLQWWAKLGYASRGVVYILIGGLAFAAAIGSGGKTTNSRGALVTLLHQPFGMWILGITIVGLLGYSFWRVMQASKDTDNHGTSVKGLAIRSGLFASAITHFLLANWALSLLLTGDGSSQQSGSNSGYLNGLFGQWLAGTLGIIFIAVCVAHIYKGWQARFERYMNIPQHSKHWATPVCRFGLIARGVVWGIIGWFLLKSAVVAYGGEINGVREALISLESTSYGPWLMGLVAAGLFSFGVYGILEAFYREINMSSLSLNQS